MKKIFSIASLFVFTGLFSFGQSVVKLQNGGGITLAGGVLVTLQDMNLDHDGFINLSSGGGIIRFTGSQDNTIGGTVDPSFNILDIAKTGNAKVSLLRRINVGSALQFHSGLLDLNGQNIVLQPTAILTGESEESRIVGLAGGYVEIVTTLNSPSGVKPGNLGAIISSPANLGSVTIRRGHISHANVSASGKSILRYYDIIPTNNTALNATFRFHYFDAELDGHNESTIVMWKSTDNINWTSQGFTTKDTVADYLEKTGIADFSRWTLSSVNGALPVEFVMFNLNCQGDKIQLNWKTAQEFNSDRFEIQKSTDGIHWVTVGEVKAAGNSLSERSYSYVHDQPGAGISFYRIAEFDIDGTVLYTSSARNNCNDNMDSWKVWPNPVQELLWINLNAGIRSGVVIKVFDGKGALVRTQQEKLLPGINQLRVNMQQLAAGIYHVTVEWNDGQMRKNVKVIKR